MPDSPEKNLMPYDEAEEEAYKVKNELESGETEKSGSETKEESEDRSVYEVRDMPANENRETALTEDDRNFIVNKIKNLDKKLKSVLALGGGEFLSWEIGIIAPMLDSEMENEFKMHGGWGWKNKKEEWKKKHPRSSDKVSAHIEVSINGSIGKEKPYYGNISIIDGKFMDKFLGEIGEDEYVLYLKEKLESR